jgi:F-type H+-transporting ATPase subunit gamma
LERAVPLYLTAFLYGAILESAVCEQSARITSMDSAARNADDMIRKLELFYNQIRQGAITQEIIEIVNGAGKNSGEVENERR